MYEEYFRLSDAPFRLNPDPRFFFGSRSHNKAMAYLHYGLKQAEGFIVITGPVGAGKSMVIGHLLDQLNKSHVVAANLLTSNIEPKELLGQILSAFRIEPEGEGRTGQIEAFEDYLFDQLNRGRRVLLIIDEAQNLPFKTLEELRMLSNIDYEGTPLFQVFLVGQPEFRTVIESPEMEQLRQRVIASYHLENLSHDETRDYILHRLAVAGWRDDPAFTDSAFAAIFEETGGLPRRINTLCNRLMLHCSLEKTHEVTAAVVEVVCSELREEKLDSRKSADAMPPVAKIEANGGAVRTKPEKPDVNTPSEKKTETRATETGKERSVTDSTPNTEKTAAKEDDVVVSIDSARPKAAAPEDSKKTQEKAEDAQQQPDEKPDPVPVAAMSSMSVLDRLRAKKNDSAEAPKEATLDDVATAIAAVSSGEEKPAPAEPTSMTPSRTSSGASTFTSLPSNDSASAPQWKDSLVQSIDETRDELKEANANVVRLSKSISAREQTRKERRKKIADSLARAEGLLVALRKADQ